MTGSISTRSIAPGGGALSGADLGALEGGAGGRGAGEQPVLVAKLDLGIGADIDDQHQILGFVGRLGEGDGGGVGADMARDAGQDIGAGRRVQGEIQIRGAQVERVRRGERERRLPQFVGVDAQEKVMHDRVHHEDRIHDQGAVDPGLGGDLLEERVHALAHRAGHLVGAAGVHHRIGNPAHQVFAEADLRVHQPGGGHHLARAQVAQVGGDGGRAEIDGETVKRAFVEAGPEMHDARRAHALVQGDGDPPAALAQDGLKLRQDVKIGLDIPDVPLVFKCRDQAFEIARGLVHVGFLDLDIIKPHGGVHHDVAGLGAFAHDLFVDLRFGRHIDDHVVLDRRLTAEAATLGEAAFLVIAFLDRVPVRQRVGGDGDPVLGELAVEGRDLAFRADAAPAADRVEIDTQLPRGGQHRRARGKAAAFARRGEDDEGVVAHGAASCGVGQTIGALPSGKRCRAALSFPGAAFSDQWARGARVDASGGSIWGKMKGRVSESRGRGR